MSITASGVTVGNAAKIAVDIVTAAGQAGISVGEYIGHYQEALDAVLQLMEERTADAPAMSPTPPTASAPAAGAAVPQQAPAPNPVQQVVEAFPGSTIVPPGQQIAQAPMAQGPAPVPGVAAPAGGSDPELEEAWQVFMNDINGGTWADNWEDNRGLKAQGGKFAKIPDFKHKSWQRPGSKYPVGLYISDKKNPAWVAGALQSVGVS